MASDEEPEHNAREQCYVYVPTPTGSEQEERRSNHRRPPRHVREVTRQMQASQEELRQVNLQQNVMNAMLMQFVGRVQGMEATMETKADADQVPTNEAFHQLQAAMETKADADQVPTNEAFHQLQATMETKADADQVPTNEVFQQLQNTVATKVQLQNEVAAINVALRQHIVSMQWRDGKTFRQGYCCETSNYRASIVMDVGFIYKIALRVIDHNRRHGAFVQGQVALLPAGNQTANGNSDNGDDSGGWSAEGHKPGVSLQYVWNINGHQYARAILTTGDTLDITLDHRSGRQIATFAKRGTEHHCSRPVEALPLFLAISLWSQGAFEITECSVSDVA